MFLQRFFLLKRIAHTTGLKNAMLEISLILSRNLFNSFHHLLCFHQLLFTFCCIQEKHEENLLDLVKAEACCKQILSLKKQTDNYIKMYFISYTTN